ncbi:MAG: hypothetical protein QG632_797 [Candidatus Dependentiae bacterium]|nr:hypothetical protein [Candidatus Dependentiae bacterium]
MVNELAGTGRERVNNAYVGWNGVVLVVIDVYVLNASKHFREIQTIHRWCIAADDEVRVHGVRVFLERLNGIGEWIFANTRVNDLYFFAMSLQHNRQSTAGAKSIWIRFLMCKECDSVRWLDEGPCSLTFMREIYVFAHAVP